MTVTTHRGEVDSLKRTRRFLPSNLKHFFFLKKKVCVCVCTGYLLPIIQTKPLYFFFTFKYSKKEAMGCAEQGGVEQQQQQQERKSPACQGTSLCFNSQIYENAKAPIVSIIIVYSAAYTHVDVRG